MRPYFHKGNLVFASMRVPRLFLAEQPGLRGLAKGAKLSAQAMSHHPRQHKWVRR
jgi:hypothetical protein